MNADPDAPAASAPLETAAPSGSGTPPPGVRAQLGTTKDAFRRLIDAHVELGKAEAAAIGGAIARLAGLVGCAIALLALVGVLVVLGTAMFLGEWLLGSLGWGVFHGVLFFTGLALALILAGIGYGFGRLLGWLGLSLLIGLGVAVLLGLHLPNQAYTELGNQVLGPLDPAIRTIVAGIVTGAIVFGLLGLVAGLLMRSAALGLLIVGAVFGGLLGAFSAITFGWQPAAGVGLTVAYGLWIVFLIADLFRTGIDDEALKERFYPSQTIETTKETLEWLKERMPRGNAS